MKVDKVSDSLNQKIENAQNEVQNLSGRMNYFEKSITQKVLNPY